MRLADWLMMGSIGLVLGVGWYVRRLHQECAQLKRDWYYQQQFVKRFPQEVQNALEPLRVQVAALAEGKSVSPGLIRSGQLYREISGTDVVDLLKTHQGGSALTLLDVRSASEFEARRLPGATLMPVEQLDARFQAELSPSAALIIVYCATGDRSRLACDYLSRQGFTNVYFLKGGIAEWPGPVEGEMGGGLIQITSKTRRSSNSVAS